MNTDTLVNERDTLAWWLQQVGVPHARFAAERPDYLIISPPKTGSTWLADNLRQHPQVFVPSIKEIKYFSAFHQSLDLSWYLDQLAPGAGRIKGEASPSYALLPVERIRLVRALVPNVKIIFLMRDPIGRAWSHAKHNHRYREANFSECTIPIEEVPDASWLENFTQDWTLAGGDYRGQLRRWLSVFPREQFYIGFYESIAAQPELLFHEILAFLGADPEIDCRRYPLRKRILPGPDYELPERLHHRLHSLLYRRARELENYLRDELGLHPPPAWQNSLDLPKALTQETPSPFCHDPFDDRYLTQVLKQEETFLSAWCPVLGAYQGYNLVFHRGEVYALDVHLGDVQPAQLSPAQLGQYRREAKCFTAPSLAQVKQCVARHVFERTENRLAQVPDLHANLYNARERVAALECLVREMNHSVQIVQDQLHWLQPWFVLIHRVLRPIWRRVRRLARVGRPRTAETAIRADRVPARI